MAFPPMGKKPAGGEPPISGRPHLRALLACVGISLLLRMAVWIWTVRLGTAPHLDEPFYWDRIRGWTELLHGHSAAWADAYGRGIWPPLHPFLVGLVGLLAPGSLALARLVGVLLSAGTTAVLYRLGWEVGGNRVGFGAALLHAFYIPLIFFAPLLYSESLFLLLLVGALLYLVRFLKHGVFRAAVICSVLLALMVLTRATAIFFPPVFLVAALLCRPEMRGKSLVFLVSPVLAALAWMAVLRAEEGRWVVMSTSGGYNLYLGNNPYIEPGHGSAWSRGHVIKRLQAQMIADTGSQHMADWDVSARRRALDTIRTAPGAAVTRAGIRAVETLKPDYYLNRYIRDRIYPEVTWLRVLDLAGKVIHVLVVAFGLVGLFFFRYRSAFLLAFLGGLAGPLISIGSSRFGLPLVAVLFVPASIAAFTLLNPIWARTKRFGNLKYSDRQNC